MATKGKGVEFYLHDGIALVKVANLQTATPPQGTRETIDVTNHDSAGDAREFMAGLLDNGEGSCTIDHNPGDASDLLVQEAFTSGDLLAFEFRLNTPAGGKRAIAGTGIITAYSPGEVAIDDKMSASLSIKASGIITMSAVV